MDIVIPIRETFDNIELRYCLRAICENVPHRKVWLAGFKPDWVSSDICHIPNEPPTGVKFERAMANMAKAMKHPGVSEDFYFFNDDFFVMKPVKEIPYFHRGPLGEMVKWKPEVMTDTINIVRHRGFDEVLDYSIHIPMKMNKTKWLDMWNDIRSDFTKPFFVRVAYGNIYQVGGTFSDDVKLSEPTDEPTGDEDYLSTEDRAFSWGKPGEYIQKKFPNPCKYEAHQ